MHAYVLRQFEGFKRRALAAEAADPKLAELKEAVRVASDRVTKASEKALPRALRAQRRAIFAHARYVS